MSSEFQGVGPAERINGAVGKTVTVANGSRYHPAALPVIIVPEENLVSTVQNPGSDIFVQYSRS